MINIINEHLSLTNDIDRQFKLIVACGLNKNMDKYEEDKLYSPK